MARLIALAALLAVAGSEVQAGDFRLTRWSENHTDLADPARQQTPLDGLKHIPLGDAPDRYLSLGGQLRLKGAAYDAPLFGLGRAGDDSYWLQRLNLHGDWHAGPHVRVFAEVGDARVFDKTLPAPIDANRSDLQLAFADLSADAAGGALTLRIGRQELAFDSAQRFVALREGPNVRRAYDGARLIWSATTFEASAFVTEVVESRNDEAFDDRPDRAIRFSGLRLRRGAQGAAHVDGYWYRYERDNAAFGGLRASEQRDVFGLQSDGRSGRLDWDIEAAYQTGEFGASSIRAWAFGSVFGYRFDAVAWDPRLALQIDAASGDRRAGDDRLQTFNPLFSRGSYFSQAGLTDFSNLVNAGLFLSARPLPQATFGIGAGHMARQSRADAAYAQPMLPILQSTPGEKAIGDYLRVNAGYRCTRHLTLAAELMHYVPATGLRSAGADTARYAELVVKFLF